MNYSEININAESVAGAIYQAIGSEGPLISELIQWVEENFGINIKVQPGSSEGFHKISGLAGLEYFDPVLNAYRIWYRETDCAYRKRFTIVHEIAHIIRNSPRVYGFSDGNMCSQDGEERFCNRFAAAFLMPKALFIKRWNALDDDIVFKKVRMTGMFKVSGDAVFYRAKELKLI